MSKKKSKESKYMPWKNYAYVFIILLIIALLCWYFLSWYKVKQEEKLHDSYLITTNTISLEIQDLDEVIQVLKESPSEYFVFISYTNDENTYNLEKKLKRLIDDYGLKDEFYYVNVTDIKDNEDFYSRINDTFNTTSINNVPCILYYYNNELVEVIKEDDKIFSYTDFQKLLEKKEFEIISQ